MGTSRWGSELILYLVALFLPIRWLPSIHPDIIYYLFKFLLLLFISIEAIHVIYERKYHILQPWFGVFSIFILIGVLSLTRFASISIMLNILFLVSVANFSYRDNKVARILHFFVVWMTVLSLYSLIITYTPIDGFSLNIPLESEYRSPVERFPGEYIELNSFGFYGTRGIYTLTSISFIFSVIYCVIHRSSKYGIMSLILGAEIINIIYLTGSGRAALVLPIFLVITIVMREKKFIEFLPVVVFSPLILWTTLYIGLEYISPKYIISNLNKFMSNRLFLYLDSITVLISNKQSLVGWGWSPWGNYALSEVGIYDSRTYGETLTRSHNFLFEFMIQYGLLAGIIFLTALFRIARKTSHTIYNTSDSTKLAASIVVLGILFTGLSVGGKVGPFSVESRSNVFWWMTLGYLIGSSAKDN